MAERLPRVPWRSIALAGLLAFLVSLAVIFVLVTGYAFALGIEARGAPDPTKISVFATRVGSLFGPLLLSVLVVIAAYRFLRGARSPQLWHGVLVGVVAALPTLVFTGVPDLRQSVGLLITFAGGLLGGYFAMRTHSVIH